MPALSFAMSMCLLALSAQDGTGSRSTAAPLDLPAFQRAFEQAHAAGDLERIDELVADHPDHPLKLFFQYAGQWSQARGQGQPAPPRVLERARALAESVDAMLNAPGLLEMVETLDGLDDPQFVRWILLNQELAGTYATFQAGQVEEAFATALRVAEQFEEMSWPLGAQKAYAWVGNERINQARPAEAVAPCERSLVLAERLGDPESIFGAAGDLGAAYHNSGRVEEGIVLYQRALDLGAGLVPEVALAPYLFGLGQCRSMQFRYHEALELHERALALKEPQGIPFNTACSLAETGTCLYYLGRHELAIEHLERAMRLFDSVGDHSKAMRALQSAGGSYEALGQYEKAIDAFERCFEAWEQMGELDRLSETISNLAVCYAAVGQNDRALQFALRASRVVEQSEPPLDRSGVLRVLSGCYAGLGRLDEAREVMEQCLAAAQTTGNPKDIGFAFAKLGQLHHEAGDIDRAVEQYDRARPYLEDLDHKGLLAGLQAAVASCEEQRGHLEQALVAQTEAVDLMLEYGSPQGTASYLYGQGRLLQQLDRPREAIDCYVAATRELEHVSLRSFTDQQQAQFRNQWLLLPLEASLAAGMAGVDEEDRRDAFTVVEASRARALSGQMTERSQQVLRAADPALVTQRDAMVRSVEAMRLRLDAASGDAADEARPGALREELQASVEQLDELTRRLRQATPALMEMVVPATASLAQVRRDVLREGTLLLMYMLGDEQSCVWILSRDTSRVAVLPGADALRAQHEELLRCLAPEADLDLAFVAPARALFEALLAPVRERAGCRELILVPDGFLGHLPFEALLTRDPDDDERDDLARLPYLLRDHAVRYAPSASFLCFQAEHAAEADEWRKDALLFGDPVYEKERLTVSAEARRSRASLDPTTFERLRGTREEVLSIAEELIPDEELRLFRDLRDLPRSGSVSGSRFDLFVGAEVNESRLKGDLTGYRILHVATHGYFDPDHPWFSGLVLSDTPDAEEGSGFLSLIELGTLRLNAQLAFLSACETGAGELLGSEGIQSTARSFLIAGARSVVCTQWAVRDQTAAALARVFYRRFLTGTPAAQALHDSKLALLADENASRGVARPVKDSVRSPHAHPSEWAPFVIWGQ